jgi:anti-anti-sigma regulatory factor
MSENPIIVQKLPNRLTAVEARSFFGQIQPSLSSLRPRIVFDFSAVRCMDVKGAGMLLRCLEIAMKENGDVKFAAIPQNPAVLSEMSRLAGLFESFETTRDAVESFRTFSSRDLEFDLQFWDPDPATSQTIATPKKSTWRTTLKMTHHLLTRLVSGIVVFAVLASASARAVGKQEPADSPQQTPAASSTSTQDPSQPAAPPAVEDPTKNLPSPHSTSEAMPDSPGAVRSQVPANGAAQTSPQQPAANATTPLGTAAAELTTTSGVAASKPAGAAFAPAKQHRMRTIVISMAAVLGAGVAVGSVVALSEGSPSKPPGAR